MHASAPFLFFQPFLRELPELVEYFYIYPVFSVDQSLIIINVSIYVKIKSNAVAQLSFHLPVHIC